MISKSANEKKNKTVTKEKGKLKLTFVLLSILIFSMPLFKGLFFTRQILITHLTSLALFIMYLGNKIVKGEKLEFNSILDYVGLLFIVAYMLPIIFGKWANLRDAIGITLRYINCFIIYLMVKEYVQEEKQKNWIVNTLIISGVVTAVIGILGAAGYVKLQDVVLANRIASTFQYPNTLAAFMMTVLFIALGKLPVTDQQWKRVVYAVAGFVMVLVFIFTYSRAAWLLLPVFILIYILALPREKKVYSILYFLAVFIPILIFIQPITKSFLDTTEYKPQALIYTIIAVALFTALYTLGEKIFTKIKEKQYKIIYIALVGIVIGAIGFVLLAFNATVPLNFDNYGQTGNKANQVQRVVNNVQPDEEYVLKLKLESSTADEKLWPWRVRVFSVDGTGASHIIAERLGSVEDLDKIEIPFQTLDKTDKLQIYFTNIYPDTRVTFYDAELVGISDASVQKIALHYKYIPEAFITRLNSINMQEKSSSARLTFYKDGFAIFKDHMFLGAGGGAWNGLYNLYQSEIYYSTEAHNYFIQTLVEIGLLGVVLLLLTIVFILLAGRDAIKEKDIFNISIVVALLCLLGHSILDFNFSYLSILILLWVLLGILPKTYFEQQHLAERICRKVQPLVLVVVMLPIIFLTGSLLAGNGSAREADRFFKEGSYQEGIEALEKAVTADPFDTAYRVDMARILRTIGQQNQNNQLIAESEKHIKKALRYAPYNDVILSQAAQHYLSLGDFDEAFRFTDRVIEAAPLKDSSYEVKTQIYDAVASYYIENNNKKEALETYGSMLEMVDEIKSANKKSQNKKLTLTDQTLDHLNKARYFAEEKDSEIQDIHKIFYFALDTDENNLTDNWKVYNDKDANIITEVADAGIKVGNTGSGTGLIYSSNFALNPSTKYKMELRLNSTINGDFAIIRVMSRSGKTTQFTQKLDEGMAVNNTLTYEFETSEDIQPGDQYIRIDHLGNSAKLIDINRLILFESKP